MFTVCPKCALTLVVTAADLRVAQGYVRCGRCSNVFNALARLSEDRQAAAAAAQAQASPEPAPAPEPTPKPAPAAPQQSRETSATSRTRVPADPLSATSKTRQTPDLSASAKLRQPPGQDARESHAMHPPAPSPPTEPTRYGDDSIIPEEDLEFNADSTDLNKVFVEQPPSPQFTAATGTFKAIRLEAQEPIRAAEPQRTDEREIPQEDPFDPIDTQVDVEIDPDLLATMAQLTSNRLERLNPTPPEPDPPRKVARQPAAPAPVPAPPPSTSGSYRALQTPKAAAPAKQSMLLQPPVEQPLQPPAPMRLAERAKARADAAADTTQAIKAALAPRKRPPVADLTTATGEQPTSFLAGMWTAGSLLLLLLLTIQVIHHYRDDLAANATLNGPLTSIYAVLGIPLVPRWDLNAYEVRQLGASTAADAPGQITVRASVKNNAHQPQPLPLLRVTLQDRFGNRIASRDVPPQSYLPRAIPSSSLLSSGQRIDADMAFVDPGSNAVGFEIDACLPAAGGGISCANDAAR